MGLFTEICNGDFLLKVVMGTVLKSVMGTVYWNLWWGLFTESCNGDCLLKSVMGTVYWKL